VQDLRWPLKGAEHNHQATMLPQVGDGFGPLPV